MRMIKIAGRLRPFSHLPKTICLIPGTSYLVEAYPALLQIRDFSGKLIKQQELDVTGPLKQFTVMQDLERGCVTVFSECYRIHILPNLDILFRKSPILPPTSVHEQLSLGCHKKQQWELIKTRRDICEIFPFWFRLGASLKLPPRKGDNRGIFQLLHEVQMLCLMHRPALISQAFIKLFLAGFTHLLVPRAIDDDHQGIVPAQSAVSEDSPLYLLSEGSQLIRSLFLNMQGNEISILPNLPPECFAGRMVHTFCPPYGILNFEWSKKTLRMLHFQATYDGAIHFLFPADVRSFRLKVDGDEKKKRYLCTDSLEIKSGSHYLLDRFQK